MTNYRDSLKFIQLVLISVSSTVVITMKKFTLLNRLTMQYVTLEAPSRLDAKIKACTVAKLDIEERHYWVVKQDYHDLTGYTELSV